MKLRLLCVGGAREPLLGAIREYEGRLGHYWRFEVSEVAAGMGTARKVDEGRVRKAEEDRLLAHLSAIQGEVVALTRQGRALSSKRLAALLGEWALRSVNEVVFVIGGAFGLGPEIVGRSTLQLSLSELTLPHEVARLVLVEQLYRAGTILRNEPYHKGP
jgi:23S rRNA (pseudouridine1915-N3)-methyltransferase